MTVALFGRRELPPGSDEDGEPTGPFSHPEPSGASLIVRADHYAAALKLYLSIFGPGTELAKEAEKQRAQWRKIPRP